jgi:hypothetical protein
MINRTKLIQMTEHPPIVEVQSKRERFYKLSALGSLTLIKKNPSPYEFWVAVILYGILGQLVFADDQIRNKLKEWIKESTSYQKLVLEKMDDIYLEYSRE